MYTANNLYYKDRGFQLKVKIIYVISSVCPSAHPFVCPFVYALLAEPFDFDFGKCGKEQ